MNRETVFMEPILYEMIVSLCLVAIFQSTDIITAAISFAVLSVSLLVLRLLLPLLATKISEAWLPIPATLIVTGIGFLADLALCQAFPDVVVTSSFFLPFPMFLILCVPFSVHCLRKSDSKTSQSIRQMYLFFAVVLFVTAGIREVFGLQMFLGYRVFEGIEVSLPILTHVSGSSFLVLLQVVLLIVICRRFTGKGYVADLCPRSQSDQPIPDIGKDMRSFLFLLPQILLTGLVTLAIFVLKRLYDPAGFPLLLLVSTIITAMLVPVIRLVASPKESFHQTYMERPYLFAVQSVIPVFPASFPDLSETMDLPYFVAFLIAYLVVAYLFLFCILSFLKAMRRKALFGKRPEVFRGIPYILLVFAGILMVFSGLGIPILETLHHLGG